MCEVGEKERMAVGFFATLKSHATRQVRPPMHLARPKAAHRRAMRRPTPAGQRTRLHLWRRTAAAARRWQPPRRGKRRPPGPAFGERRIGGWVKEGPMSCMSVPHSLARSNSRWPPHAESGAISTIHSKHTPSRRRTCTLRAGSSCSKPPSRSLVSVPPVSVSSTSGCPHSSARQRGSDVLPVPEPPTSMAIQPRDTHLCVCGFVKKR